MSAFPFFLAQETLFERLDKSWRTMSGSTRDVTVVFGVLLLLVGAMLIWALYFRRRNHHHHHHHHRHHHHHEPEGGLVNQGSSSGPSVEDSGRKRRRRRRRGHRPRNPTLAETGGLPPVRTERPPGPVP